MLGKNKIKFIRSLEMKKFRSESGCFLAEGNKLVSDILPYFDCELLVARTSWIAAQGNINSRELIEAEGSDIKRASLLKTPQDVLAVFRLPSYNIEMKSLQDELSLVIDGVQTPGNLGTIVRIADWFGIRTVVCSPDSADVFSPKTVQATMGAIARVKVIYTDLPEFLDSFSNTVPVYGAFLEGKNIYREELTSNGLIVIGNEGNGIRDEVAKRITNRLHIPSFPPDNETGESLNVAAATAIICAEYRRREIM
ncbi:MAG: RNA methyltransferase [Dysgonamonadaceae bacterium]|jgi:TrmH family RNA methyltransferase|nr:RNA methyltransferase [Dysgonamonadaceae bacterium]